MRKLFILTLFALISNNSYSQTLRVDAGLTFSKLEYRSFEMDGFIYKTYEGPVVNHSFGINLEYLDQKHFTITSGFNLYRTGGEYTQKNLDQLGSMYGIIQRISLDYISLNNTVNFNPINGKVKLQFQLGPRIDYLLTKDFAANVESRAVLNYGITSGIGIYYNFPRLQIGANAMHFGRDKVLLDEYNYNALTSRYVDPGPRFKVEEKFWLLNFSVGYKLTKDRLKN